MPYRNVGATELLAFIIAKHLQPSAVFSPKSVRHVARAVPKLACILPEGLHTAR